MLSAKVRVIAKRALKEFWRSHPAAAGPLKAWFDEAKAAQWSSPRDVKERHATASVIRGETVVFNIGGNKYRLVAKAWWEGKTLWIKFVGTHAEYDKVEVEGL